MALLHADSMGYYADADKATVYTSYVAGYGASGGIAITTSVGARGGSVLRIYNGGGSQWSGALSHTLPAVGNICGFAMRLKCVGPFTDLADFTNPEGSFGSDIMRSVLFTCRKSSANLWWAKIMPNGKVAVYRSSTKIAESSIALTQNVYTYIEVQVRIDSASGYVKIHFDEVEVANVTSLNTTASGDVTWDEYRLGQITATAPAGVVTIYIHDFSVYDGDGDEWNDFQGDYEWDDYRVTANGTYAQFTPSAGTNYQNVDETLADGSTTYNASGTTNAKDSFTKAAITSTPPLGAVVLIAQCLKESGSAGIKLGFRIGSTNYEGSELAVPSSYGFLKSIFMTNPATGSTWTATVLNAAELLYEKVS